MSTSKKRTKPSTSSCEPVVPVCPQCNNAGDVYQLDVIAANTPVQGVDADGDIVFVGETDVDWDSQRPAHDPWPRWRCNACGHEAPIRKFLPKGTKVNRQ